MGKRKTMTEAEYERQCQEMVKVQLGIDSIRRYCDTDQPLGPEFARWGIKLEEGRIVLIRDRRKEAQEALDEHRKSFGPKAKVVEIACREVEP